MANALPTDLTTISDFKAAQNVQSTADDAWIQQLITRASAWIEQQTNRKLVARRYNGATATAPNNIHPTTLVLDEDYWYIDGDPRDERPGLRHGPLLSPAVPDPAQHGPQLPARGPPVARRRRDHRRRLEHDGASGRQRLHRGQDQRLHSAPGRTLLSRDEELSGAVRGGLRLHDGIGRQRSLGADGFAATLY